MSTMRINSLKTCAARLAAAVALCLCVASTVSAKVVTVGSGSGYLNYPTAQTTLGLQPGDTVYIAAGTYSGLSISNIAGTADAPITIKCDPNAVFSTATAVGNSMANLTFVRFEDFRYESYAARCMNISGRCHDLLFKNFHITNIGDWVFRIYDSTLVFDGTKDSTYHNFKFENVVVDGGIGGVIINSDWASVANLKSMALDFEIVHCSFSNLGGTVIGLSKAFNLKVHDCLFSNMGGPGGSTGHNSMIDLTGYATIYNNRFTQGWGDDVRAFPIKLNALGYGGSDAVIRFYNNISWEKKKYPMYEHNGVAQADLDASAGLLSRTASEICFNTLYRSRKVDYIATLVDILYANVTIKHNLVIEPECDAAFNPTRNYVYQVTGGSGNLVVSNNLVYSTFAASGLTDAVSFVPSETSPARNSATGTVPYIAQDHYGGIRYVGAGDVGAVERQLAGDFNGDGTVTHGDYTAWADNFGRSIATVRGEHAGWFPLGSYADGATSITQGLYTTWADHFGDTAGSSMIVGLPNSPAVSEGFCAVETLAGASPNPGAAERQSLAERRAQRLAERRQARLDRAALRQQRRFERAAAR